MYRALVAAGTVLAIEQIDSSGNPWTGSFEIDADGQVTTGTGTGHSLALNDDSWERAEGRTDDPVTHP